MPNFSAFTPYGQLAFSSRPPVAQRIYDALRAAMGGDENITSNFNDSHIAATLYARSMVIAGAKLALRAVEFERRPAYSTEALPDHEKDYGIRVPYGSSLSTRRAALKTAKQTRNGYSEANVIKILDSILGPGNYKLYRRTQEGLVFSTDDANGNWDFSRREHIWKRIGLVEAGPGDSGAGNWTKTTPITGSRQFLVGERLVVCPGANGIQSPVIVKDSNESGFQACFDRTYPEGTLVTNAWWPQVLSNANCLTVVTPLASNSSLRNSVIRELNKLVRATHIVHVVVPYSVFGVGQCSDFVPIDKGFLYA